MVTRQCNLAGPQLSIWPVVNQNIVMLYMTVFEGESDLRCRGKSKLVQFYDSSENGALKHKTKQKYVTNCLGLSHRVRFKENEN
jgi:hypothetical protein